jgi:hypothetical protein
MRWCGSLLAMLLFAFALVTPAYAQQETDPVGAWVGSVSWNERPIRYVWEINRDGTFSSGREGRGLDGSGAWSAHVPRLTLKYGDGFRYEGELRGDDYSGSAYGADGRVFGSFSMSRARGSPRDLDSDE